MANNNLNSGYGQITGQLPFQPIGKVFAVGDTSTVNIDILKQLFIPDPEGTLRFTATLDGAMNLATADAGDRIYLMPGHTETIAATGTALIDKAGVSVIGLGVGTLNPLFNITTTSGKIQITARDTTLKNVTIQAGSGSSGCAAGIELLSTTACKNITIDGVTFQKSSAGAAFDTMIDFGTDSSGANYFDGLKITNNVFRYYTTSVTGAGIALNLVTDGIDYLEVSNNKGTVFSSGGWIQSSGTSYGTVITGNVIHNQSTSAPVVDLNGTAIYGTMGFNTFSGQSTGAYTTLIDPGGMNPVETYVSCASAANKTGRLPEATIT